MPSEQIGTVPAAQQQQTVPGIGDIAGSIMAGGPSPIMTPQQLGGISPIQLGTGGIQPASRSLVPPMAASFQPGQMQSVPWGASLEARRTVKQQNLGTMLGNLAGAVGQRMAQKQFADKVDVIQKGTTALDQIQKAKAITAPGSPWAGNLQMQQYAQKVMRDNEALLDKMQNDPKQAKILKEAKLDFTDPKSISTDDNKQAAVQALKNVQQGNQVGTNANTPEEKAVQDAISQQAKTQAPTMSPQAAQAQTREQIAAQQAAQQPQADPFNLQAQPTQQAAPTTAQAGAPTAVPANVTPEVGQYSGFVNQYAGQYKVDPNAIYALMGKESGGNPNAVSSTGAAGLMQLTKGTAKGYGISEVDRFDPEKNIMGGVRNWADAMKRQGNDPALAAADYFHGPKAVQGGQIVDPEAKLYSQDFMKKYNAMGGPGAETAGTPTGGVTPTAPTSRPPDMTQAAAPSPTSMGGPSFTPAIPGAPKGLNVVDASKTPTPHLDAYMKANPTVMEQNPQYAMMMERNAMMEKAYYEKIAPKMMDAYTKAMLQNDKLQSDQWKTMVQAYTRLQTSENTLKGRIAAAGISEEGRVQAATIAGEKAQLVQQMRTDTALQLAGLKGVSGWAGLKVLNGMVTQNGNLIGRMQSAIGSAETARENALARVKGDEQKTKDVNDRYDALEQKYNDIINNTYTLNDKLRVAANSTLMSNPGMEQFLTPQDKYAFGNWQQQMPQQGGGGIGGGAVSPFFNQQLSPNIGGAGPSPSSPQPPAGATSTTPAPSSSQGTAVPSGEIGIINGIFGKPAY